MPLKQLVLGSLLFALLGCGATPLSEHAKTSPETRDDDVAPTQSSREQRPLVPISASLSGPEAPRAGERLTLTARITRKVPLRVPVQIELVLPAGVELIEGERVLQLSANTQVDTHSLRYVVRADVLPHADLKLVVSAAGKGFGFHTEQAYRFGRSLALPVTTPKDGVQVRVGDKSFGRSVDITPR